MGVAKHYASQSLYDKRSFIVPTEVFRVNFDTDAKTGEWYYTPEGVATVPCPVRRVVVDGVSSAEILIGTETAGVNFVSDQAGSAYTKMIASLNYPSGTIAYCYDIDSTKHGRYVKTGATGTGGWGARVGTYKLSNTTSTTGSVTPKMWTDENHRRVGQLHLLFQSWSRAADAYAPNDASGPYPDKLGLPDIRDLRGYVMRWRLRAQNMEMGPDAKIVQHFQTRVPRIPPTPSTHPSVKMAVGFVNAINIATCISDKLGFGTGGLYAKNAVDYVADSGWVDVDIPLTANDSAWLALGALPTKTGRWDYAQAIKYVCASAEEWLANWTGNAYMCAFYRNPAPGSDMLVPTAAEAVKGRLLVQSLSFISPT
jgi:hypothetical protein